MRSEQKARLQFQCRRGMLELDALFERFMQKGFDDLSDLEIEVFERLLAQPDPVLLAWLMGKERPVDEQEYAIVLKIKE